MDIKETDRCVCGDEKLWHVAIDVNIRTYLPIPYCAYCFSSERYKPENYNLGFHEFKLNNLDYIERLAKERNLI